MEKSSFYQCVRTETLKRTFSFGHHSRQSSEQRSKRSALARYRMRYFFEKWAELPLSLLVNYLATIARYFSSSLLLTSGLRLGFKAGTTKNFLKLRAISCYRFMRRTISLMHRL